MSAAANDDDDDADDDGRTKKSGKINARSAYIYSYMRPFLHFYLFRPVVVVVKTLQPFQQLTAALSSEKCYGKYEKSLHMFMF